MAATDHLIGMKFGTGILDDDDMNHLKNKRIRSVADLLQDQWSLLQVLALGRLQHAVQKTLRRVFIRQSIISIIISTNFGNSNFNFDFINNYL